MSKFNILIGSEDIMNSSILTKREKQVFEMLINNKTTKEKMANKTSLFEIDPYNTSE